MTMTVNSLILVLLISILTTPVYAQMEYYVDKTASGASNSNDGLFMTDMGGGMGPWLTIGQCNAEPIMAGDNCNVLDGEYDEAVSITIDGLVASRIQYLATTGVEAREFLLTGDYVTINNFIITNVGMTPDFSRSVDITVAALVPHITNNTFQHTSSACLRTAADDTIIRGNTMSYCGEHNSIFGTDITSFTVTAGVDDQVTYNVEGGMNDTITLPAGAVGAAQRAAFKTTVDALLTGATIEFGGFGNFELRSSQAGPSSDIELVAVANDGYAHFGWTVGDGVMQGVLVAIQSDGSGVSGVLVEDNTLSFISDFSQNSGGDNRWTYRNNIWGPNESQTAVHNDFMQAGSNVTEFLVEGNTITTQSGGDNHLSLWQQTSEDHFIWRYNETFLSKGTVGCDRNNDTNGDPGCYMYNNTYFNSGDFMSANERNLFTNMADNNFGANNIFYNSTASGESPYSTVGADVVKDFDLWFAGTGDPIETNDVNADPLFVDGPNGNFNLTPSSPAINAGGHLTTVAVADTGSGTSLILNDANMFQDGWGGTTPDMIAVGTVTNTVAIISIVYATNTIMIASGISRSDGENVWLKAKSDGEVVLNGAAPDIGAFESGAGLTAVAPGVFSSVLFGGAVR